MIPIKLLSKNECLNVDAWVDKDNHTFKQSKNIIYGRLDSIESIFNTINAPSILVTDSGDISLIKIENVYLCATDCYVYSQFRKIPPNVKKWFSTSLNIYEPVFSYLPLGTLPEHIDGLIEVANNFKENRKNLLYTNFNITSAVRNILLQRINDTEVPPIEFTKFARIEWPPQGIEWPKYKEYLIGYFVNLLESKFVLAPLGMGIDTFRMYEAMYLGCIPIILKSAFSEYLKDFPVMIIDSYENITEKLLNEEYDRISSINYNLELLTKQYYLNQIQTASALLGQNI